jgi:predicted secreted protein
MGIETWECTHECTRKESNGAFVEDILGAAVSRLEFYQAGKFACDENAEAIMYVKRAMEALCRRTIEREIRKVEGTAQV